MRVAINTAVDHAVINVRSRLDEAQQVFRRLGFDLTHRGHHSIGTSNHLAIFGHTYLELLGFVGPDACPGNDLVKAPIGLRALALRGGDPDAVATRWATQGLLEGPSAEFSRPVAHATGIDSARFRIFQLRADWIGGTRLFYCHHYTPELIWRDEWRCHANGVTELIGVDVSSADPANAAAIYGEAFGTMPCADANHPAQDDIGFDAGQTRLSFLRPEQAQARYGATNALEGMVGLRFASQSLLTTRDVLAQNLIPFRVLGDRTLVVEAKDAMGVGIHFVSPVPL